MRLEFRLRTGLLAAASALVCTAPPRLVAQGANSGHHGEETEAAMAWAEYGDARPEVVKRDGLLVIEIPQLDWGVDLLEERAAAQLRGATNYEVFHRFRFTDRQPESGIDFVHRIVSDAGKTYKPVHYDHGNGLSVADVDGDGLLDVYLTTRLVPTLFIATWGPASSRTSRLALGWRWQTGSASRPPLPTPITTATPTCS